MCGCEEVDGGHGGETAVEQRPLAGSVDIVEQQRSSVQVGTPLTMGYSVCYPPLPFSQ